MTIRFPEEIERAFAKTNTSPGKFLYLRFKFPHQETPEDKYFLMVGEDFNPLLLKINSELTQFIRNDNNKMECQYLLKECDYGFLQKDSYLDCSIAWYTLTRSQIEEQLYNDRSRAKGEIHKKHAKEVIKVMQKAKAISPKHKNVISQALTS